MSDSSINLIQQQRTMDKLNPFLRYSAGSALIMMVATGADYTLAYLTPVLALSFLAPGARRPTLAGSAFFLTSIAVANLSGMAFATFFLPYPMVFLPLLALVLFLLYYTTALASFKLWLIISLMVIPMVNIQSPVIAGTVALNLFINAFLAIGLVWMTHLLFPSNEVPIVQSESNKPAKPSSNERLMSAVVKSLVVMPVMVLFFIFEWTDSLLVLIFISVLSMNPSATGKKAGIGIIVANLGGGIAAIIAYHLLTVATSYIFFGMVTFLTGLLFARGAFSARPAAPLYGMAFSTFLLMLGNVVSMAGEAGEKVWMRVLQIGIAVVYMTAAFGLYNRIISVKPKHATV